MDRLVRILFPIVVVLDAAALMLIYILGLAAAPSSRTSFWAVTWFLDFLPAVLLGLAVLLFIRATSPMGRGVALLLAAAPLLVVLGMKAVASARLSDATDAEGNLTYFRAGPMRDIAEAVVRNDTAVVAALAPRVNINARGFAGTTLLIHALRQLRQAPQQVAVVGALLKAGADPNLATGETPLELALQLSRTAGSEPVRLLLEAGADPNTKDQFGNPVFFAATGAQMSVDILRMLLDHRADLAATDRDGRSVVFPAAQSPNWPAVLYLLERGVDWKSGRNLSGLTFKDMVESHQRVYGDSGGVAKVIEYLNRH